MPDTASNAEIEDVLTSIRRLVSENRPVHVEAEQDDASAEVAASDVKFTHHRPAESEEDIKSPDALVLTAALRVVETDDHSDAEMDPAESELEPWDAAEELEPELGEVDMLLDVAAEEVDFEEGADDFAESPEVEDLSEADFMDIESAEDVAFVALAEGDDEIFAESSDLAEGEAAAELDEQETPDQGDEADEFSSGVDAAEEAGFVEMAEPDEDAIEDESPFDFKKVLEARMVHWKDAENPSEVIEPDEPGDSEYAGTEPEVEEWAEPAPHPDAMVSAIEERFRAETLEGALDAVAEADLAEALEEPAEIDEEALREMVADIVRQELQGALGERITRNVRKLVRREIHRALAAHDLD